MNAQNDANQTPRKSQDDAKSDSTRKTFEFTASISTDGSTCKAEFIQLLESIDFSLLTAP